MNPIYRFYINGGEVFPNYRDDLSKDYELETGQRFYREKLSGKLTFMRGDYDFLYSSPFETEFVFTINISYDSGQNWLPYYTGTFMKTDCTWDDDSKKCTVQPNAHDRYNNILAGLENEYNLIELAPEIERIIFQKRPLIQVYALGDDVLSCFLSGVWWEQSCQAVEGSPFMHGYNFARTNTSMEINLTVTGNCSDASGIYAANFGSADIFPVMANFSGVLARSGLTDYKISLMITFQSTNPVSYIVYYELRRNSDNLLIANWQFSTSNDIDIRGKDFDMNVQIAGVDRVSCEMATRFFYARLISDAEIINGNPSSPIPSDDITDNNLNYRYAMPYPDANVIVNPVTDSQPTRWGTLDSGIYYTQPDVPENTYPISRSRWRYSSFWFMFTETDFDREREGRRVRILRDSFPLHSAIQVLLREIAPELSHGPTPEYSEFLYGEKNPVASEPDMRKFHLFITQKSNVLHGDYDRPAQKAPVTLQQIMNMLRDVFRCWWYIEDNKLKIEHVSWFKNGGSYSGIRQVETDLTRYENPRNSKKWGYLTSAWEFDKPEMAGRFEFAWADGVTKSFEGFPVEVLSKYVTAGKKENISIASFTSDIDYMMLNPGAISLDGFAILAATYRNLIEWGNVSSIHNGIINTDGTASPPPPFEGTGWMWAKMGCTPGMDYVLLNWSLQPVDGVYFHFYDLNGNSIGRFDGTDGRFTTPDNCHQLGITWRDASVSVPQTLPERDWRSFYAIRELHLSLPFVERNIGGQRTVMQNGYLSFTVLHPNFWMHDLPAKRVKINGVEMNAAGIERKRKQTVIYPALYDPDPAKLVGTHIGNGQCEKFSINLHSRINKAVLKYDTE